MPQQKGSWTYTTRYHLQGDAGLFFPISGPSNVTSVCLWIGSHSDGAKGKVKPGGKATALSSHCIVSQPTQDPRFMQVSLQPNPEQAPRKLAKITNNKLHDDPAFSTDPLTNPLFASHIPPAWDSPPAPGHPSLQKQRRAVDGGEIYPPQPPNTPAVPDPEVAVVDNRSQSHSPESTASSNPATISSRDSPPFTGSPLSSPPSLPSSAVLLPSLSSSSGSTNDPSLPEPHVHPKGESNSMPHHVHQQASSTQRPQQVPQSKPETKKRQGFFSRLLGPPSGTESSDSSASSSSKPSTSKLKHPDTMLRTQRPQHPHPHHDMRSRPAPAPNPTSVPHHHPSHSAPEVYRSERPSIPQRVKTVGTSADTGRPPVVPAVAAAAAAGRAADERGLRPDLDRIDELDETNPFGLAVHHRGPYEAISRIVQKGAGTERDRRPLQIQATGGRNLVMSGDVYRNAQIMALQMSLNLRPGQILPREGGSYPEPTQPYPHPYPHPYPQSQPEPYPSMHHAQPQPKRESSRHHNHHTRHAHPEPSPPIPEYRSPLDHPAYTQKVPSVLRTDGSLRNFPMMASASSLTESPPTRQRTPSPIATANNSNADGDAGLAIGMALMGTGHNLSHVTSDAATAVGTESEQSSPVPIKIVLREPTEVDEPNPPPYAPDPPQSSILQMESLIRHESRSQEPTLAEGSHMGKLWNTPSDMPQPQPFAGQVSSPQFVPVPTPAPTASTSRHASWHPQPAQAFLSQSYVGPRQHDIHHLQLTPSQQLAANPSLSRSSTYHPGFSGPSTDRQTLAASLKSDGRSQAYSSSASLRDRESDTRSVQQSIMTTSNTSNRSYGENPRRNRYLPKRLVMPAPLQPTMQNQAMPMTHQVRFEPQANVIYAPPQVPSPPKGFAKRSSTFTPQPPRAQEIPITHSNGKLRKRSSLFGGMESSKQPPQPPVAAVSFSANIVSADKHARGVEKPHKKVLSKRK
ncbi:hypothetical protein D9756_006041 [Leucocoprinus leucothites]|uniref:Uncharacterized protein n=1 Tax=Leucocoprinus leucothites TaxID=201217 RepID=A0A8H5FXW2_9AGAR|nr:hypothetical protein D9756_006041 [Leucoagaricus leucothites]